LNFYGNVEANDIFKGTTDIVVSDGFCRKCPLSGTEGVASMIVISSHRYTSGFVSQFAAIVVLSCSKALKKRLIIVRYERPRHCSPSRLLFKSPGAGRRSVPSDMPLKRLRMPLAQPASLACGPASPTPRPLLARARLAVSGPRPRSLKAFDDPFSLLQAPVATCRHAAAPTPDLARYLEPRAASRLRTNCHERNRLCAGAHFRCTRFVKQRSGPEAARHAT